MACEFPVAVKAKLIANCYTLVTLLTYFAEYITPTRSGGHNDLSEIFTGG